MQALLSINASGKSEVAVARLWECKAIVECGMIEADWGLLSIPERARKIVAINYSDWLMALSAGDRK